MTEERRVNRETGEILEIEVTGVANEHDNKWEEKVIAVLPTDVALIKVVPGMDLEVRRLGGEAIKLSMYANKMTVASLEDEKQATNDLVLCRDMIKQTEAEQKRWLEPVKDAESKIKAAFALILAPLKTANETMTGKITEYRREERRKADEAAEIAREESKLATMKAKAEGKEPPPVVEVIAPEQVKTHRAEIGSTAMTIIWRFEVTDFSLLPDRFKIENAVLIGKLVRAGERSIPGVRIYSENQLRVTGRRG